MLGRFHEISVTCEEPLRALTRLEALGYKSLTVGEIWSHPYAVVSDGRLTIGLHGAGPEAPVLAFVQSNLSTWSQAYAQVGVKLDYARLGEDEFNELSFVDPGGQTVRVLESRTYSPPPFETIADFPLGRFAGIELPACDPATRAAFWRKLGADVNNGILVLNGLRLRGANTPHIRCAYRGDVVTAARRLFAAGIVDARVAADDSLVHCMLLPGVELVVYAPTGQAED